MPFIANLHGTLDDTSSWIFTKSQLLDILNRDDYRTFITTVLCSNVVVFIGITVDDESVGGHFSNLKDLGIKDLNHFWITSRRDIATDEWAEAVGIRIIRYNDSNGDHRGLLSILQDLYSYIPKDIDAPPVTTAYSDTTPISILPSPKELKQEDAETIRKLLNEHASNIIHNDPNAENTYKEFCQQYAESIYRAWYITSEPPDNILLEYKIIEPTKKGAFGQVYRAEAPNGEIVAIKVLHESIRHDDTMLQCFRRGVQAMGILSKRNVKGMVAYKTASEIPACAVMSFIEGPDLRMAVENRLIVAWEDILRIAFDLTSIVRSGHRLPERVLHRDIRPSNVMLKNYYNDPDNYEVVVLDFDLSWHRDAYGVSVDHSRTMNGYLAPEQCGESHDSTRNALVDSYGIGMTLYYMRSAIEPIFMQHKHENWNDILERNICHHKCDTWKSLPRRYARLIMNCTNNEQSKRPDMSYIVGELYRLQQAMQSPDSVLSLGLIAEEMASRSDYISHQYTWHPDENRASICMPTGVEVDLIGDESKRHIKAIVRWADRGDMERSNIKKWIPKACDKAKARFSRQWELEVVGRSRGNTVVQAILKYEKIDGKIDLYVQEIDRAIEAFKFE